MADMNTNTKPSGISASPHLVCAGPVNAIDFYKRVFGAEEIGAGPATTASSCTLRSGSTDRLFCSRTGSRMAACCRQRRRAARRSTYT